LKKKLNEQTPRREGLRRAARHRVEFFSVLGFTARVERGRVRALALAALGVVFGDIGTSPLYTMHVCFAPGGGLPVTPANVLGVVSLIVWSLLLVVTLKYVGVVMRADLHGEGGILALMALATGRTRPDTAARAAVVALGLFGAALLYGDGMLTPAISVLSAVEGLKEVTPFFEPAVVPLTAAVLVALFAIQHRGTGRVGTLFGPIMLVWFATLAVLGLRWIAGAPGVLAAADPRHGVALLTSGGWTGYAILGSVFLAVTGGEALYADIGHFGARPIRLVWLAVVLPAVAINYFGQAAMLLQQPAAVHHTFYSQAPGWALVPLLLLATAAAVIASQAVIAGAFSLTAQALQLGFAPRVEVRHSSPDEEGQVYVPFINGVLLVAAVGLVLAFRSSAALAGAYGVAVSATMVLTTMLAAVYFSGRWGVAAALGLAVCFLPIDLAFLGANLTKIGHGGAFPLLVAAGGFALFTTWRRGQARVHSALSRMAESELVRHLTAAPPLRTPGTAVYLSRDQGVPRTLLHTLALYRVLHRLVIVLSVRVEPVPRVRGDRLTIERFAPDLIGVVARYGYMERPNVPRLVRELKEKGIDVDLDEVTYVLAHIRTVITRSPGMAVWRKRLYALLARNAYPATSNYRLPSERVLEVGVQVEI
jgi:KUP system potassium uptake protein